MGTSGFAYPAWKGRFYPEGTRQQEMLSYYADRFSSVEINYTFGRFPTEALLTGWAARTPPGFAFALKAPRKITHELRLRDAGEPLERFVGTARVLGERLGPILFQTPPSLEADKGLLATFLAQVPAGVRCALEFRHPSWDTEDVREMLAEAGAAWCVADTDEGDAALHRTAPGFVYLRLRKTEYPPEALDRWAASLTPVLDGEDDVFCYFKHTDEGRGVDFARALSARLGTRGEPVAGA